MDYTAVGQTTHLAARMEQLADPGATLLTPETLALAEGFVQVTSLGPMAVKGLAAAVEVYELTGISAARSRLQAAAARGLSRFVGRDAEIEQLRRALEPGRQGRGQVAAVVGEPGVGKSRLTFELTHSHRARGLAGPPGGLGVLRQGHELPARDRPAQELFPHRRPRHRREILEKVTGKILTLDRALEATLPALLALLDASGDDPQWQALDPPQRRQRTLDAIKRLLLREAQVQPLLVVFEDLHWIDSETQALLDSLVESLPPARLLLLVNYRPEYEHRWGSKTSYTQVRLDPLPPESAIELLHGLLGEDTTIEPLTRILIERTEGNPFFLEESVRALVETRALVGERGAYRLANGLTDIQVPPTVQAILAARIDRLSPEDKRLLQSAAVIGKDVPFALLAAIADEREEDAAPRARPSPGGRVPLRGEPLPRPRVHVQARADPRGGLPELAQGATPRAARSDGRGDRTAVRRPARPSTSSGWSTMPCAARCGTRPPPTECVRGLGRRTDRPPRRPRRRSLRRRWMLSDACPSGGRRLSRPSRCGTFSARRSSPSGSVSHSCGASDGALSLAERLGDEIQVARALALRTTALWFAGDNPRALESGHRAVTLAEAVGHRIYLISACLNLGLVCQTVGDYRRGLTLFAKAVDLLGDDLERERLGRGLYPAVLARNELAASHAELGQFDVAAGLHEEAVRLAEELGHSTTLLMARLESCESLVRRAAFHDAIPRLEVVLQAFRDAGLLVWAVSGSAVLGYSLAMTGRLSEGIALLRAAIEQTAGGRRTNEAHWIAHLVRGAAPGRPGGRGARSRRARPGPVPSAPRERHGGAHPLLVR